MPKVVIFLNLSKKNDDLTIEILGFLLEVIVVHLDAKYNSTGNGRDDVGDEQGPVLEHQALDGKENAAQSHHQEGGQRDTLGVVGTDGVNRLGHIAKDQANRCCVTDDVGQVVGDKIHHDNIVLKKVGPQWAPHELIPISVRTRASTPRRQP